MNNAPAMLRTLIIYAMVVPLAITVGYLLTNPMDYTFLGFFGVLGLLLAFPLLMRWHYPVLLFSWSSAVLFYFLPGAPSLWLVAVVLSLGVSVFESILISERHFIRVPQLTRPLVCLIVVVLFTAKMTGGIGLHALGSEVYGGKKYLFLLIGILSYFAITAQPIPPDKAQRYVALFFLGAVTSVVGDLYGVTPSWARFIFYLLPPTTYTGQPVELGVTRLGGIAGAGVAVCLWMLARYGLRGIFLGGTLWRPLLWIFSFGVDFLGGFRSGIFAVVAPALMLFFMEGLHRTRLLLVAILSGTLMTALLVPLASHLPFTFQRSLAFLPLDITQEAKDSAAASTDWRMGLWKAVLPQVPEHLLLGKGFVINPEDYNEMMTGGVLGAAAGHFDPAQDPLALSYDYHNGILSVVLPFGIWGVIAYVWFMAASLWVLYRNWKYGNPELRTVNAVLFATCLPDFLSFLSCMAGFVLNYGAGYWAGHVGLSVALNNGVCRKTAPVPVESPAAKPLGNFSRLRPGLQR